MCKKRDPIEEELDHFIFRITQDQIVSWDELRAAAEHWDNKDYQYHKNLALRLGEKPSTVILTALLHASHPVICTPTGPRWGLLRCKAEILAAELEERNEARLELSPPVDNFVDNFVDK